jgi:uncharacterized protein (TIGR02246 family)
MRLHKAAFWAFAFASAAMFAGCQTAQKPGPKKDLSADMAAIDALRGKFSAAFNSNDPAALAALYADDAIVMFENQSAVEGKPAIQARYAAIFEANRSRIAVAPVETTVAGDWAFDRGNVTTTITPKSGKASEQAGRYLAILKRQPGDMWQLYRIMDNSISAPPPAPVKKAAKKAPKKASKARH